MVIGDGGRGLPLDAELGEAEPVVAAFLLVEFIARHAEADILVGSAEGAEVVADVVGAVGNGQRVSLVVLGEGGELGVGTGFLVRAFHHDGGRLTIAGVAGGVEDAEYVDACYAGVDADVVVKSVGRV